MDFAKQYEEIISGDLSKYERTRRMIKLLLDIFRSDSKESNTEVIKKIKCYMKKI